MPSANPLFGIHSKIERAQKHITDLDSATRAFLDSSPYQVRTRRDLGTRKLIYFVAHVAEAPPELSQIAGDALGNMVSVLDHLAYRLFLKSGTGGDGRHVYFPIGRKATTAAEYKNSREAKVKGIAPHIIAAIDALEAYKGGKGHQLWVLNELNNLSKHRDLITVGSMFRSVDLGAHIGALLEKQLGISLPSLPAFFAPADRLCPLKIGDELFIDAPDAEPNVKMAFRFEVALSEPEITNAEPLLKTVHHLAAIVSNIVKQFASFL